MLKSSVSSGLQSRGAKLWIALATLLWLIACTTVRQPATLPTTGGTPANFPGKIYQANKLATPGTEYRLDSSSSGLRILAYRGGELARFGHNHVVTSTDVQGLVLRGDDILASQFALFLVVDRLIVDDPRIRAEEGEDFSSTVSEADREATRRNMLGEKVLDAAQFPFLKITGKVAAADGAELTLDLDITLRGVTNGLQTVANITRNGDQLIVVGSFSIRQSDYGITPFSALLDKLKVKDELTIKYRVEAVKVTS